jgi:hypothetical protein
MWLIHKRSKVTLNLIVSFIGQSKTSRFLRLALLFIG